MKTRLAILSAAALLAFAAAAQAKGPSQVTLEGPGLERAVTLGGGASPDLRFQDLVEQAGFFGATFHQTSDPTLETRPRGVLGPRYTLTYVVPGPAGRADEIRQDVYPHAAGGPVTYMRPGQPIFDRATHGGWFRADPALKMTLAQILPEAQPTQSRSAWRSWGGAGRWALLVGLASALVALAAGAVLLTRRQPRAVATP